MSRRGIVLAVALCGLASTPGSAAAKRAMPFDFNSDGRQELVIGVPSYAGHGAPDSGAVAVVRGSASGLNTGAPKLLTRASRGVAGNVRADEQFGRQIASADFNRDGYADLAIAGENPPSLTVLRGSRHGLSSRGSGNIALGRYGYAVALLGTDFNRDGFGDLAVGQPWRAENPRDPDEDFPGSGTVRILFGGARGLAPGQERTLRRRSARERRFGTLLAAGDVTGDGYPELVEGDTGIDDVDSFSRPGQLDYCKGGRSGPTSCRALRRPFQPGPTSLAMGDVTGDGHADVIAGFRYAHFEDHGDANGAVLLWQGARRGPARAPSVLREDNGVGPGAAEFADGFGATIDVGRIDADRLLDIVVAAPGGSGGTASVAVLRGAPSGVTLDTAYDQGVLGLDATRALGSSITLLDASGDGKAELVVNVGGGDATRGTLLALINRDGRYDGAASVLLSPQKLGLRGPAAAPSDPEAAGLVIARVSGSGQVL